MRDLSDHITRLEGAELVRAAVRELPAPQQRTVVLAAALKHMERCASCQAEVALLAAAADRLLDLVPERGAPDGFESGPQAFAGAFHVGRDGGLWVIRLPMPSRDLTGARLVGPGGTELASATFT